MKRKLFTSLRFQALLGLLLVGVGLFLYHLRTSNAFVDATPVVAPRQSVQWAAAPATISGEPVSIAIPSLNLNLPIIDGVYSQATHSWTLTKDKVQYATVTPPPNNVSGNTFLYGHYRSEVFATLHLIKPGAQAVITTANGHTFTYTYTGNRVTDPSDTSVFNYRGKPMLTVQTCTGMFFQYRQLFSFEFSGVS